MLKRLPKELLFLPVGIAVGILAGYLLNVNGWRSSEADHVREAATAYLQSFANDDPAALCASISPLGRTQLQFSARSCEDSAKSAMAQIPKAQREALKDPDISVVSVANDRAAVRYSPKLAGRGDMQLIKLRGQWLVNS
jgi:hypothetical protein